MPRTATGRLIGTETERRSEPETKTQILAAGVTDDAVSPSIADCRGFSDNCAHTRTNNNCVTSNRYGNDFPTTTAAAPPPPLRFVIDAPNVVRCRMERT